MASNMEESVGHHFVPLGQDKLRLGRVPSLASGSRLPGIVYPDPRNAPTPTTPCLVYLLLPSLNQVRSAGIF